MSIINEALKKVQDRQEHLKDDDNSAIGPPDRDNFPEQNDTPEPRNYIPWLVIGMVLFVCVLGAIGFNLLKIKGLGLWQHRTVVQTPVEEALIAGPEAFQEEVGLNKEENTVEIVYPGMKEDTPADILEEAVDSSPVMLLELRGIVLGKGGYYTIINDKILEVGDSIGGYSIISIESDEVLLVSGKRKVVLDLK